MPYSVIKDFRRGLDMRKFFLSQPEGSLIECINGHITQGGEIEKRKAFVPMPLPAAFSGIHFGMQPSPDGIYIFGSFCFPQATTANRSRTSNVASLLVSTAGTRGFQTGDVVNIVGVGGTGYNGVSVTLLSATNASGAGTRSQTITYASTGSNEGGTVDSGGTIIIQATTQLPAPFVYVVLPSPNWEDTGGKGSTVQSITKVRSSTLFSGKPFVIAEWDDGTAFPYYGSPQTVTLLQGTVVQNAIPPLFDSYTGLQLSLYSTLDGVVGHSGEFLLKNLAFYMNNLPVTNYSNTWTPGATNFDILSVPTTLNGTPYTAIATTESAAGAMAVAQQSTGLASIAATAASGSFQVLGGDSGSQATGIALATANPADNDTLTVGSITYRFKNTMAAINDIKISTNRWTTFASLAAAINGTGTSSVDYFSGTVRNPSVYCYALSANGSSGNAVVYIAAITGGSAGNSLALSKSSAVISVSGSTLTGAVDSQITQIVVNGATNLLSGAVAFTTDIPTTVIAIVANINANVASGYSALANNNTVTIFAQVPGATPNGFSIQVQAQGTMVTGSGAFTLTGSGFSLDYCQVNGVDLLNDSALPTGLNSPAFPFTSNPQTGTAFSQVLSDFCRAMANNINTNTSTNGYIAFCAQGSVSIYISKATTASTDKQVVLNVNVTPAAGDTGAVLPITVVPLSASLSTNAVAIPGGGKSSAVTCNVTGGVAPYTYSWVQQVGNVAGTIANNKKSAQTTFSGSFGANANVRAQLVVYRKLGANTAAGAAYLTSHPALNAYLQATSTDQVQFACVVTDALGEVATSDSVFVTLLGI